MESLFKSDLNKCVSLTGRVSSALSANGNIRESKKEGNPNDCQLSFSESSIHVSQSLRKTAAVLDAKTAKDNEYYLSIGQTFDDLDKKLKEIQGGKIYD